jgi:serine/threonine protein kinase
MDKPNKSNEIYGVLPYMAPEVLRGNLYTKASDVYSFGIIMWEMTSGIPAFNNLAHDFDLSLNICQGLRPDIVKVPDYAHKRKIEDDIEVEYVELMKRCWDSDPDKRPPTKEICENFDRYATRYSDYYTERIPVPGKE